MKISNRNQAVTFLRDAFLQAEANAKNMPTHAQFDFIIKKEEEAIQIVRMSKFLKNIPDNDRLQTEIDINIEARRPLKKI